MSVTRCARCGNRLASGLDSCPECGWAVSADAASSRPVVDDAEARELRRRRRSRRQAGEERRVRRERQEQGLPHRPRGIATGTLLWLIGTCLGLVVNSALLLVVMVVEWPAARGQPVGSLGVYVFFCVMGLAFHALVLWRSLWVRRGLVPGLQRSAWLVQFCALVLLAIDLIYLGFTLPLVYQLYPSSPVSHEGIQLARALVAYLTMAAIPAALLLYLGAVRLLWHTAEYAHWVRHLEPPRPLDAGARDPIEFPSSIRFAGWSWFWLAFLLPGLGGFINYQVFTVSPPTAQEYPAVQLLFACLMAAPFLVLFPLALLLLWSRLASTAGISVTFLIMTLVLGGIGGLIVTAPIPPYYSDEQIAEVGLMRGQSFGYALVLGGLAGSACLAGLIGATAYRTWLERVYGLRLDTTRLHDEDSYIERERIS